MPEMDYTDYPDETLDAVYEIHAKGRKKLAAEVRQLRELLAAKEEAMCKRAAEMCAIGRERVKRKDRSDA